MLALRLAAIAALEADPVIAQLCPGRVYDSRLPEISHREPMPVIIVATEELEGDAWSANNGGAPFDDRCLLTIEIAMNAIADDDGEAGIWIPATDPELAANLDLLQHAVEESLTIGETEAARLLRRTVLRRVNRRTSSHFKTDDTGERLAIRLVTLHAEIASVEPPDAAPDDDFAALPEPLRSVALSLRPGSGAHLICTTVAAALATVTGAGPFAGMEMVLAPRSALDPDALPLPVDPDHTTFGFEADPAQA